MTQIAYEISFSVVFFTRLVSSKYERMGDQKTLSKTRTWNTYSMPIVASYTMGLKHLNFSLMSVQFCKFVSKHLM
jgi:hypothetical protein